jgi:putative transcriptional regulator
MNLVDHFLVSMPSMDDPQFNNTVIYVCEHTESGAMGVVINQATDITVSDLFDKIDLQLPLNAQQDGVDLNMMPVLNGGPVQHERGFVLHEPQTPYLASIAIGGKQGARALTTSRDVLEAVSKGTGPDKVLITLGYSGWAAGQLETEVSQNAWLTIPANLGAGEVLWNTPLAERKAAAMRLLGIDPNGFMGQAGHA